LKNVLLMAYLNLTENNLISEFLITLGGVFVTIVVMGMACIFILWIAEKVLK
jgi:hypothetical protein